MASTSSKRNKLDDLARFLCFMSKLPLYLVSPSISPIAQVKKPQRSRKEFTMLCMAPLRHLTKIS